MSDKVQDKHGQTIEQGDNVYTKFRGGKHEGEVEAIATTKEEAEEFGVKNPPKVSIALFLHQLPFHHSRRRGGRKDCP